MYVKYTLADEKGFKIKVMGQELGGYEKYLHVGSNNSVTVNEDSTDAAAEYNITKNSDGTLTKELKFLKDTTLNHSQKGIVYTIESDSDLTVNLNENVIQLTATASYAWPVARANCIRTAGNLTITGGGILKAAIGAGEAEEGSSTDKSVNSVIYSGSKITIDDIEATLYIGAEKSSLQANVLYAPQVEFTDNANVKMAKNQVPAGTTPGYLIGTADTAAKVVIPDTADVFLGSSKSMWGQEVKASDKLYDYTYDNMKTSTYMEVSTTDAAVAISSVSVNNGQTVSNTANTVKFTTTAADSSAPQILVLAKACGANGVLTSAAVYSGSADGAEHELTLGGGESIKLYVWSAADGLKPLKKVRTYYAADTAAE